MRLGSMRLKIDVIQPAATMKKSFFVILLLFTTYCHAQVAVDSNVIKHYNQELDRLNPDLKTPEQIQNRIDVEKEGNMGFVIFTTFKIDTLNKTENIPGAHFEYSNFSLVAGTKELTHINLMCMGYNDHDTLKINLPIAGPFLFPLLYQKIISAKVSATLQYINVDPVLRLDLKESPKSQLDIPVSILKYNLNTSDFSVGNTIYGEAEILSEPYYIENGGFKTGHIQQRFHFNYVFKFKVLTNPFTRKE